MAGKLCPGKGPMLPAEPHRTLEGLVCLLMRVPLTEACLFFFSLRPHSFFLLNG